MYKLKSDGTKEEMTDTSLDSIQKAIGGYFEPIYLANDKVLLVDDEGKLKQKPLNHLASAMATKIIVGDVIVANIGELQ